MKKLKFQPVCVKAFPKPLQDAALLERWGFSTMASATRREFANQVSERDKAIVQLTVRG